MPHANCLSIIIPTFNEADNIAALIYYLRENNQTGLIEIIVTDGGSTDDTRTLATSAGANVMISPKKGRGAQMNYGAMNAKGDILYFLHADSIPPMGFGRMISEEIKKGYSMGCFRLKFDTTHWFLKANAWFSRFDVDSFRFGDQSLFVFRDTFIKVGGFNEKLVVMEDQEIIKRLKKFSRFKVMPEFIITSARKYRVNGIYKMQGIFFLIYMLYKTGVPQKKLIDLYRKLINQDKV